MKTFIFTMLLVLSFNAKGDYNHQKRVTLDFVDYVNTQFRALAEHASYEPLRFRADNHWVNDYRIRAHDLGACKVDFTVRQIDPNGERRTFAPVIDFSKSPWIKEEEYRWYDQYYYTWDLNGQLWLPRYFYACPEPQPGYPLSRCDIIGHYYRRLRDYFNNVVQACSTY